MLVESSRVQLAFLGHRVAPRRCGERGDRGSLVARRKCGSLPAPRNSRGMTADGSRGPTHHHSDGTVTVYTYGRRVAENLSEAESNRLAGEILG
jgi:hypothetical protein